MNGESTSFETYRVSVIQESDDFGSVNVHSFGPDEEGRLMQARANRVSCLAIEFSVCGCAQIDSVPGRESWEFGRQRTSHRALLCSSGGGSHFTHKQYMDDGGWNIRIMRVPGAYVHPPPN